MIVEEGYKLMDYFIKGKTDAYCPEIWGTSVANVERIKAVAKAL